ncbi:MAG: M23 family metallopeptidase, partial [Spirochaetes bacterium]|nr:M23 family metallopeptidase [Spirochaetota bacterium]
MPVKIPAGLSATLGEIRGNSLHQGIDIKTNGRIGYPVYPASPGFLSRFISRENGYGNSVFLAHEDGRQTIYGHLDSFEEEKNGLNTLRNTIKTLYNSDDVDFRFADTRMYYRENDVIAYTGESGSGQPHIHFEIREGERYLNPLQYVKVSDTIPPVIENIFLCVERDNATVEERRIPVKGGRGKYSPAETDIKARPGAKIFFKVSCYDQAGAINRIAVYSIKLLDGTKTIFERTFDYLDNRDIDKGYYIYDISRSMIRDGVSYAYFLCNRDGSGFEIPKNAGRGYINTAEGEKNLKIEVRDFAGNAASVKFALTAAPPDQVEIQDNFTTVKKGRRFTISNKDNDITFDIFQDSLPSDRLIKLNEAVEPAIYDTIAQLSGLNKKDILKIISILPADEVYGNHVR